MELSLSAVLVTWNSAAFLSRCLDALRAQSVPLELIHLDNASSDDSAALVRDGFPDCTQIVNDANRGFTGAVNQAVAVARGEFVLLLNPDAFLAPDYAARVIEAMRAAGEAFGMATGKLLRFGAEGIVDSKGIRMTRTGRHLDVGQGLPDGADDRGVWGRPPRGRAPGGGRAHTVRSLRRLRRRRRLPHVIHPRRRRRRPVP